MTRSASFAPQVPPDARLLILGSLPGTASLAARQYYAHPRNQFWKLLGAVVDTDLEGLAYADRLDAIARRRIGLWDVIAAADRPGSLDASIRNHLANDLPALVAGLPDLRAIAFNGGKAFALGRRMAGALVPLIALPSSSPANARMPVSEKQARWRMLQRYLVDG